MYSNSNTIYELATIGGARYILDPDCADVWKDQIDKKEPFLGQICYISESKIGGYNNKYKIPEGKTYFLVTVQQIAESQ